MNRIEKFGPAVTAAQKAASKKRWCDGFALLPSNSRVALRIEARHRRILEEPLTEVELAAHDADCARLSSAEIAAGFAAAGKSAELWLERHDADMAAGVRCTVCRT